MGTVVPFGRWPSPLGARRAGAGRRSRSALRSDGHALYWVEGRPEEGGRQVVVRAADDGTTVDVVPSGASARSRVHEYGGGAFCLLRGDVTGVAYVEQVDQRVWRADRSGTAVALTAPPPGGERWAHGDLRATPDGRWVLCVRERHGDDPGGRVHRALVAVPTRPGEETVVLCSGRDFYAAPRPDPDGRRLAWTCWDHPDMPWDASEVWEGALVTGANGAPAVVGAHRVDGGRWDPAEPPEGTDGAEGPAHGGHPVSVGQPLWDGHGGLVYVSDRGGWWRPWRWSPETGCRSLTTDRAEYHAPDWALGQATMARLADGSLACRRRCDGLDALVVLDPPTGTVRTVDQPCVVIDAVCAHRDRVAWLGATAHLPSALWWGPVQPSPARPAEGPRVAPGGRIAPTGGAAPLAEPESPLHPGDVSVAEAFTAPGVHGRTVHGLLYPPRLRGVEGPPGERPPLVVHCHGGPTGANGAGFDPVVQYLTTRGFAVAAVDYAGSTGYGRPYRDALTGGWGEADVDDCVAAARFLASAGRVDGGRMAVRGSSAGGFTALCALARADAFAAAATWYPVTDLLGLVAVTHDFERHYTDRLVGPLPQAADDLRRRSPVHRIAEMSGAVLLLQGLDDPVVPPAQATAMAEALRAGGHRCELLLIEGEGHGFRRAETVERCLEAEVAFYHQVLCPR